MFIISLILARKRKKFCNFYDTLCSFCDTHISYLPNDCHFRDLHYHFCDIWKLFINNCSLTKKKLNSGISFDIPAESDSLPF